MRKELKNIAEPTKPDAFASVAGRSVRPTIVLRRLPWSQSGARLRFSLSSSPTHTNTYISEISKFGRMFYVGYRTFTPRPQSLPYPDLDEKRAVDSQQSASAEAKVNAEPTRRRTAAQSMPTKRKTGTLAKGQSSSNRSSKAKRKAGSVRRRKR